MVMMIFITIILDFVLSNITLKTLLNSLLLTITSLILKKALLGQRLSYSPFTDEKIEV